MGKFTKRPKSYYINQSKKAKFVQKHEIPHDIVGFLGTCNSQERDSVREAYGLLNEAADILYGKETFETSEPSTDNAPVSESDKDTQDDLAESDDSEDIESELKKDLEGIQAVTSNKSTPRRRRFGQVPSGAKNCIFISTTVDDPTEVSVLLMDEIIKCGEPKSKHLCKLIPVQITCKANVKTILEYSRKLLSSILPKDPISYYIEFKSRNTNHIQKDDFAIELSNIFTEVNLNCLADYKEPDYVFFVNIIKTTCCLSLLPKFLTKYAKYNLLELPKSGKSDSEKTEHSTLTEVKEPAANGNDEGTSSITEEATSNGNDESASSMTKETTSNGIEKTNSNKNDETTSN